MKNLILSLFVLFYVSGFAQKPEIDSLQTVVMVQRKLNNSAEVYSSLLKLREYYILNNDTDKIVGTTIEMAEASRGGRSLVEALNILEDLENSNYEINPVSKVSFYQIRGSVLYEISNHKESVYWAKKGLKLASKLDYTDQNGLLYNLLGSCYGHLNKDSAIYYTQASIDYFLGVGGSSDVALPYINLARLYIDNDDRDSAKIILANAIAILDENDVPIYRKMSYQILAMIYIDKKDYKQGVKYLKLRDSVNFVINNSEITFQINQFQDRLQKEKSENQRVLLQGKVELVQYENKAKNVLLLVGLVLVVLLGLVLFFVVKSAKARTEVNVVIAKKARELEELNMFKNKVISVISHDMRTPLAQIITLHQAKNSDINFTDEELKEMEKTILASTKSGLLILDNLLKWATSQLGGLEVQKEELNSRSVLSHILNQVSQMAIEKGIELKTNLIESNMVTDEGLFEIVMRNVLSNAIKFSPENSVIDIYSEIDKECFIVSVQDQGPGIPDSVIEKVSKKQVIKPKKGSFGEKGAGIGLTFSSEFAKKLGGELTCLRGEDGGTLAVFKVPLGFVSNGCV